MTSDVFIWLVYTRVMILAVLFLLISSLLASGIVFKHQRWLSYLAAAGVLFEGEWLLLTLVDRLSVTASSSRIVFFIGSCVLLLAAGLFYRRWTLPVFSFRREVPVLIVLALVLAAAVLIANFNGYQNGDWVTHGFYNGDTATFISLVQRSLLTDELVRTNPFAGGGELEYPTLVHAGVATALTAFEWEEDWLRLLPVFTFAQIALTVPLLFLLWDLSVRTSKERWLGLVQVGLPLYVLALAWDNYVYPQSHFFLTALFLLLICLLQRAFAERHFAEYIWVVPAGLVTLVLLLSNAVTGTAAVAATCVFYFLRAADKSRPIWQRADYLLGVLMWLALFLFFTPGEAAWGLPQFSYTAAGAMLRLSPVVLALLAAFVLNLEGQRYLEITGVALMLLAVFTFFGSTRDIVVENAERFFYYAVLVAWPALVNPLIQLAYYLRRRLLFTTLSLGQTVAGWGGLVVFLLLFLLPAGASVAGAHANTMFLVKAR